MIAFFRKIRTSLVSGNQLHKYLLYAIGEIVLVVIGILVALQINTWNNERIDTNREAQYLRNIERDLTRQLSAITVQMDFESEVAKNCDLALASFVSGDRLKADSTLAMALGNTTSRRTFLNPNPAYKELVSTGNIALLKNEDFKDQLINYYLELERIERIIGNNNMLYTDQIYTKKVLETALHDQRGSWEMMFKTYERQYKPNFVMTDANRAKLLATSEKILNDDVQELVLVNHLNARKSYAMAHVFFLLEFKTQTKQLLDTIQSYYDTP
ncbi:MAG: hypothetical protein HRT65_09980 [Flavobacteriaceae bacterium]|nr:hypothetical protein [Flavobacteriaceae bacterium]